eukprot:81810-Chlamydomonas_euryale.AAC.1
MPAQLIAACTTTSRPGKPRHAPALSPPPAPSTPHSLPFAPLPPALCRHLDRHTLAWTSR